MKRRTNRKLDELITEIHRRRCAGWTIDVMDIRQVFDAGYKADAEGRDVEAAVVDTAALLRQN